MTWWTAGTILARVARSCGQTAEGDRTMRHMLLVAALVGSLAFGVVVHASAAEAAPSEGAEAKPSEGATPQTEWPGAFAVRGIPLGIPLSTFRTVPHPDHRERPDVRVICSTDSEAIADPFLRRGLQSRLTERLAAAGVIVCDFFVYFPQMRYWAAYGKLMLADLPLGVSWLFTTLDGAGDPVLYAVDATIPSDEFRRLVNVYTTRYGPPTTSETEPVQTRAGARFTNEVVTWHNPVSSIRIEKYAGTIRYGHIAYDLMAGRIAVGRRLGAAERKAADDL